MMNSTIQYLTQTILIVLSIASLSSGVLTTFGKSNPQRQNSIPPRPTPARTTRECTTDLDCRSLQNTSCIPDRLTDSQTRCLCGDYSAPINGKCSNIGKAAHLPCRDDSECHEGAECIEDGTIGKECHCKEGYYENYFMCNGAESLVKSSTIVLVASLLLVQIIATPT